MKLIQSSVFRALCAIVVGALLVTHTNETVDWIIIAIGVMFLLSGIISCIAYLYAKNNAGLYQITAPDGKIISSGKPTFPIVGIGSIILGALIALAPGSFLTLIMYILGVILVIGALSQYFALFAARKWGYVSWGFWVCPSIILLAGLFVLFYPSESASFPIIIIGWTSILYGVTEIINNIKIFFKRHAAQKAMAAELARQQASESAQQVEEAEVVEIISDDSSADKKD